MKKSIILSAFALAAFVAGTNKANAQEAAAPAITSTATATVNVNLAEVISIDPQSAAVTQVVNFNYLKEADYRERQNWRFPQSLIVTSTRPFDVTVKANGANFEGETDNIPVGVLNIKPVAGEGTTVNGSFFDVVLSTESQNVVSNAALGSRLDLGIDYEISAVSASSTDILGKPAGKYTQTITYTATAL